MVLSVIEYNHGKPNNKSSVEGGANKWQTQKIRW